MPLGLDKKVGESRVCFVGARVGQHRLKTRDHIERDLLVGQVGKADRAQLGVVFRADQHSGDRLQRQRARLKLHPVGQKSGPVGPVGMRRRVRCQRKHAAPAGVAQIQEAAVAVTQQVVAPAGDVSTTPAADTGAVGAQCHTVIAVGEQLRGLPARSDRIDIARVVKHCVGAVLWSGQGAWIGACNDLARRFFMQQRVMRLNQGGR